MTKIRTFRKVCLFAIFLFLVPISETSAAENVYVSPGESIQEAVDNVLPGDTIFVKPGEYNESIQINQDNLTIISYSKNPYNTVITGTDKESNVFKVVASNVTISGFSISDSKCGIYLNVAQNCIINNNIISGNNIGICLSKSENNTLSNNIVSSNVDCGIKLFTSSGNTIYNNFFNNTNNARDDKLNTWNRTSGNCWSAYTGQDVDADGIGDTAYVVNRLTKSMDHRPLINFIPELPVMPEAIFTSNVTVGYAPLTVEFTDVSENASSLLWNLGNLGISNSSDFLHTFVNEGNYTVILNVTNENGSDSTNVTIHVLKAPDPSDPIFPEVKFGANGTVGYVPLTIQFFDFSENADSLSWGFGDGKMSCCPEPKHTFCCPGNYTVSLTAKNDNGSSSACVVIRVLKANHSSTENTVSPEDAACIVNPKNTEDSGSSLRNESNGAEKLLNRKSLESIENFALSFTGTQMLAEVGPSVEYEILRLADTVKTLRENSVSRSEIRNISIRAMFFGFLGIALGLSAFRRSRK
ncbi:Cell surface protein [Methanosarcina barkeri str. Wiesmoor]|uniref:Cell surface protein n=2 Tax=Methanosarcina barkeri TaxID=2208 RepID=A0A0E3QNZ0_METBA|nr:PKD domain-containing protein [Methanosarcina barkeri]AKB51824.1 Cell surface protein [Methanosarcina barkeri str. Wiesmoor]